MKNPKYLPNKKNGGIPPECKDARTLYVPTGCGNCIECRKQKAREWQVRLAEELKSNKFAYFITFTFSNESLQHLSKVCKSKDENSIATKGVRLFLERWRRKYKKSLKHWFITELGHEGTERIHIHGIIFSDKEINTKVLEYRWKYGWISIGDYCTQRTINYIVKYVTKIDKDHKDYKPIILNSAGIGAKYWQNDFYKNLYRYKPHQSIETYTLKDGSKVNLPIYYRNHFYTEEERELLWRDKLDKNSRYVLGVEVKNLDTYEGQELLARTLLDAQRFNESIGFGKRIEKWKRKNYTIDLIEVNTRTHDNPAHAREN